MKIIIDFDGTISTHDTIDLLLEQYGKDQSAIMTLEEDWVNGKISAHECLSKQLQLVPISVKELTQFAQSLTIDEGFIRFYEKYKDIHSMAIVSDGLENIIRPVLEKYGIIDCPIYSGHWQEKDRRMTSAIYPYHLDCPNGNGTCKCYITNLLTPEIPNPFLLIGDGRSDFCLAQKAHFIFAKDKLAHFCRQHCLPHQEYRTFEELETKVSLLSSSIL